MIYEARVLNCLCKNTFYERFQMEVLAGGVAASVACIFTNPLEVVKNRLQLQAIACYGSFEIILTRTIISDNMVEHEN